MIPDGTKIQSIDLRVRDLNTSLEFYSEKLGFKEIEKTGDIAFLSANGLPPYLIKLVEDKNAQVRISGTTGLYHVAFLFPNREELARVFLRLLDNKVKFQGFSDHLVSEAVYLSDPDGNGIELYTDKPKDTWEWKNGEVVMDSLPLDLSLITNELKDRSVLNGIHPDTIIGHIHLNVSDLRTSEKFFNEVIGLNISNYSYPGARFYSAGGYHHHIGTNTWTTNKKLSGNKEALGMISFTFNIPDKEFLNGIKNKLKDQSSRYNLISEVNNEIAGIDGDSNIVKFTL